MIRLSILCVFFLLSCARHGLGLAGPRFDPSDSLCVDGLLVNLDYMGCRGVFIGMSANEMFKVRCTYDTNPSAPDMTQWHFIALAKMSNSVISSDHVKICDDHHISLYVRRATQIRED